jgi:type VI secretion system protein ImpH
MATSVRRPIHRVASNADTAALSRLATPASFWQAVADTPYAFDWFFLMRWVDARSPTLPRFGRAGRAADEALRIAQKPSLMFAPATIASIRIESGQRPTIVQYSFGLFGVNGPMPLHMTELAHEREAHNGDKSLTRFADIFHHRAGLLFYRAWADAQSTVGLDRPGDDNFSRYVSSLIGYGVPLQRGRDSVPDHAKRHFAGHMVRETRNSEGLSKILTQYFQVPVQVHQWQFHWMALEPNQLTRLGRREVNAQLGVGAIIGSKHPDRQHKFRLQLGPTTLTKYESFLPKQNNFATLIDWVRNYVGYEFDWDVKLVLVKAEVPALKLGGQSRLGWTTWIGSRTATHDADDLVLHPENIVRGPGAVRVGV